MYQSEFLLTIQRILDNVMLRSDLPVSSSQTMWRSNVKCW